MRFQSLSVRARLLWLTLGLIVPLAAAGFFNLWSFWLASRKQLDESLIQQAQLAASAFEQQLLSHQQTLQMVSLLAENLNENTLGDHLNSIVKARPEWIDLQIVDRNGVAILEQKSKPPNLQAESVKSIKDEAEREDSLVVTSQETPDKKLHTFSFAQPIGNGNFVVAKVDVTRANAVFEDLDLPEDNIIAVFDRDDRLVYRSRVLPEQTSRDEIEAPFFSLLKEKRNGIIEIESPFDGIRRIYGLAQVKAGDYVVAVGVPSTRLYEPARRQFARQALFAFLIASLAIVAVYVFARNIVRPLHQLAAAARAFGAGDLNARTEVGSGGTIRELEVGFNEMAGEIAARQEQLRALDRLKSEFVSSVSHELRTPLTTIKTLTRVLKNDKISPGERSDYLEMIAAECDRQIEFVQNLLDLSRIEAGAYKISMLPVDISKLLPEIIETKAGVAAAHDRKLQYVAPSTDLPHALTDLAAVRQIVSGIIENAIKYSNAGDEIWVVPSASNDRVVVEIIDNGCGIAAADLPHIFEKFYRGRPLCPTTSDEDGTQSVNEKAGVGLGLYLVYNLVKQIGGEITVRSPVSGREAGTKFTIFLPAAE